MRPIHSIAASPGSDPSTPGGDESGRDEVLRSTTRLPRSDDTRPAQAQRAARGPGGTSGAPVAALKKRQLLCEFAVDHARVAAFACALLGGAEHE